MALPAAWLNGDDAAKWDACRWSQRRDSAMVLSLADFSSARLLLVWRSTRHQCDDEAIKYSHMYRLFELTMVHSRSKKPALILPLSSLIRKRNPKRLRDHYSTRS